jgi:hypothetical protein
MSYEIVNNKRSKSVVRVTGNTATTITLSALSTGADETITAASIAHVMSQSDGAWKVYRADSAVEANLVLDLTGAGNVDWPLSQYDITIANNSTSNLYITNSGTGGTLILTLSKLSTYSPALTGM